MKLFNDHKHNPWFWAFMGVMVILFFAMPMMSQQAGNSGDELKFQVPQGDNVLRYYSSHGADTSCMTFENLKYYGSSFDVVTAWFNRTFHVDNIHLTRHAANAFLGWVVILFVALIAYRMAGWRAALLAALLMFFSPRFLGHSFNNPKDIPFAAGVTMAIYYIMMFFRQAPKPKWSTMIMLAFSFAFALSIRVGALIIVGYLGFAWLLWLVAYTNAHRQTVKNHRQSFFAAIDWRGTVRTIGWALAICIVGFFAGLLLWPYAWQSPFKHTMESYQAMSHFAINIRQIFEGRSMMSNLLPWYYTPKYILITIPLAVIIGWVLFFFFGAFRKRSANQQSVDTHTKNTTPVFHNMESILILFFFLFPVCWIVYTKANVYGGWRHSLFAYPPMVTAAALGFNGLIAFFERKQQKVVAVVCTVLPVLLLIPQMLHTVRNHPYEYVYFNEFVGGTKKQLGQYEMDYYYHSMREGVEWVAANADTTQTEPGQRIKVGSFMLEDTRYFLRHDSTHFKDIFLRYRERNAKNYDYAVFNITAMDPEYLRSEMFPPKNTVHAIQVDGVPICIILRHDDRNDFIGHELLRSGNIDSALYHLRKALDYDPNNECVLFDMCNAFLQRQQSDSLLATANIILSKMPHNAQAVNYAAYAYLYKNDVNSALNICHDLQQYDPTAESAYAIPLNIYMQQRDFRKADGVIQQMLDHDVISDQMIQSYIQLMMAQGLDQAMAYRSVFNTIAKRLEEHGRKDEAAQFRNMLK